MPVFALTIFGSMVGSVVSDAGTSVLSLLVGMRIWDARKLSTLSVGWG